MSPKKNYFILFLFSIVLWYLIMVCISLNKNSSSFSKELVVYALVIFIFFVHFYHASLKLKLLALVIIPLSYLGELIFSIYLGWYDYYTHEVPLYIPIGHAVVYSTGYFANCTSFVQDNYEPVKRQFLICFFGLYILTCIIQSDTFSLCLGLFLFILLKRKNFSSLYIILGIVVYYLECIGTNFGIWTWKSEIANLHTFNPPVGSIIIYVGGDVLLNKLVRTGLSIRGKVMKQKTLGKPLS